MVKMGEATIPINRLTSNQRAGELRQTQTTVRPPALRRSRPAMQPLDFINRWKASGGAERANAQLFLAELCDLLEVERPQPARNDPRADAYVFERQVPLIDDQTGKTTTGRIDLYKRGCFILETKQAAEQRDQANVTEQTPPGAARGPVKRQTQRWRDFMAQAQRQADRYVRNLPVEEPIPPFLVVADVGHSIELFAEFTRTGRSYRHFPDPNSFRIGIDQLKEEDVRNRLRLVWTDPLSLDPAQPTSPPTSKPNGTRLTAWPRS